MRTIALLAITGLIAAAEQPKNALSVGAQTALSFLVKEAKSLDEQQKTIRERYQAIIAEECQRVHQTPACKLNEDGTLAKIEPPKDVKK